MKLGIIGLPGAGKTTVFEALTGEFSDAGGKTESRLGTIRVPDPRIDRLSEIYQPRKTIYAQVEYFLPGKSARTKESGKEDTSWTPVRDADALIHVIRNFTLFGLEAPNPAADFRTLDQELILMDLAQAEKRLERMDVEAHKAKKPDPEERELLEECHRALDAETPLRRLPDLAFAHKLRGYAFFSAKPMLVLFNNADEDDALPADDPVFAAEDRMIIRGKLEHELAQMSGDEAAELLTEFDISAAATDRVVKGSYRLLGLISFFTVGEDEVRAWTIKRGTVAVDAAEVIHSDIKKGFIRAEVVSYDDFMEAGSMAAAKKKGTFRLEGKTYEVQDGDIINFRFNV
ncbi:MAG: redox-regulated ATPase YchF [Desulfobacterales bacterium CG23_combo_of_CG06-09_8_20_14_all_51_8]|nr:MAG: redox-regulated ATPase YchF [Desulfobacterales bacterium CG23_combo_of_CG06-09_8_20_14_all_51_8]